MSRLDPDIACSSPAVPVHSTTRLSENTETGTKMADLRFDLAVFSTTKFRDREAQTRFVVQQVVQQINNR